MQISLEARTTNCRLNSNISQIWLLYETWGIIKKFDSMESLGVCYWYVRIPQCGYMEQGLAPITFYVQKHMTPLGLCSGLSLVHNKPLGAPTFVRHAYFYFDAGIARLHGFASLARPKWESHIDCDRSVPTGHIDELVNDNRCQHIISFSHHLQFWLPEWQVFCYKFTSKTNHEFIPETLNITGYEQLHLRTEHKWKTVALSHLAAV